MATTVGTDQVSIAIAADGTSSAVKTMFRSGRAQVQIFGSGFGGGTVTLFFVGADGSTSIAQKDIGGTAISASANAMFIIEVPYGTQFKAVMTGSTNPSVTVYILQLKEMR